ncbi:hypothetical protein EX30DRAFT_361150 [Ascodesmis nigricans]|uniref:MutL C-terminal dimerisation domain-containing protein n=1 Tax=Ascodesmis nigricans TaxID=341454 RepID=A0A4S2N7J1_9PEZI|nr:hypothetical protein EX30DRAFT_361150 [Ascodesmis nigricans]
MSAPYRPILPLPADVRARIRSTITILDLKSAISELIQNSLDAAATSITITANLARNSCAITDNGHGIPASQLESVGTLYNTSKYPPSGTCFGSRGEALSAIAQHAMLSITSRADGYRSSNMIRWAYGKVVFQGPAPEHLALPEKGTTVRVDGLWANMPVRLKALENLDKEKEWEGIVRCIVELLMSGRGEGVAVVVRDENSVRRLIVKGGEGSWDLRVLKMAGIAEGNGWEPVKAKQNGVRIEGWISTKGAVGRGCQFLYINGFPLKSGNTLLHTEVNNIFTNSSFGVVEEVEEGRKDVVRRGANKKSAERKGMFVLRIECRSHGPGIIGGEGGTDGKAGVEGENLKAVLELLQKLIYEFLKAHHFRPFKPVIADSAPKPGSIPDLFAQQQLKSTSQPQPAFNTEERISDMADFSHAKTAKKDNLELSARNSTKSTSDTTSSIAPSPSLPLRPGNIRAFASRSTKSVSPCLPEDDALSWFNPKTGKRHQIDPRTGNLVLPKPVNKSAGSKDKSFHSASATQRISLQPPTKRIKTSASSTDHTPNSRQSTPTLASACCNSNSTTSSQIPPSHVQPGPFVKTILSRYSNPIFALPPPTITPIPSLSSTTCCPSDEHVSPETHAFTTSTSLRLNRITKASLQRARVIAQVDDKYILLFLPGCPSTLSQSSPTTTTGDKNKEDNHNHDNEENTNTNGDDTISDMLVILDQHAASERIRVETLFSSLCSPTGTTTPLNPPIPLHLPPNEIHLALHHQPSLRRYGLSFLLPPNTTTENITITSLPAVAFDRLLTSTTSSTSKPLLLRDFLRRWLTELNERLILPPPPPLSTQEKDWWTHLASLPTALKDMVNSRACRGAVMFGDKMTLEECTALVRGLGETKWPFMCAHGRVGLRPLVELGEEREEGRGVGGVVVGGVGRGVGVREMERAGWRGRWGEVGQGRK